MTIYNKLLSAFLVCLGLCAVTNRTWAQQAGKGTLSGSFETNSMYYIPDSKLAGYSEPKDRMGSNNFLKLDYTYDKFSVGLQFEFYAPVLQGFETELKGGKIMNRFVSWADKDFSITVGDFYEQFGSGMILRTYEDRALGFNNSLEGARISYKYNDIVRIKGVYGRPRLYMDYADVWVRGADVSLSLSTLAKWSNDNLALEGSFVNRYEESLPDITTIGSPNTNLWSGRVAYENHSGFFFRGEYVGKTGEVVVGDLDYEEINGNGQLLETGYNSGNLGITATYRRVKNMGLRVTLQENSINNTLNYTPSLTRQHSYMLANLEPHATYTEGEQGGLIDVYYNFRKGSALGGKHGMKVHLNGSLIYPEEKSSDNDKYNLLYSDIGVDIEKQWDKKFKTIFLYSMQSRNPNSRGTTSDKYVSHIFVLDMLYKFTRKTSLRAELQYLGSKEDKKDWVAGLVELNIAPRVSIFASDMYNQGDEEIHYYNGGVSYSHSRSRIALSFGRSREGFVCSGGVCRRMPAYTGGNLTFTTSF